MFTLGEKVRIRDRNWEVRGLKLHNNYYSLFVKGIDSDNSQEERCFIYPVDDVERLPTSQLQWEIGQPKLWKALHDSYLLTMVYGPDVFSGLINSRIRIEDYQLDAALTAMSQIRPRMLIADDVGLGKTIESSLIMMELAARGRADRVLIVTPASLMDQWVDEMEEKFGLEFVIFDSASITEIISKLPRGANPWKYYNKVVASIDYTKREDIKRTLRDVNWDLVMIDEAHYLSESGSGGKAHKTERSKFGEFISERTDSLLLLTATPHDGYSHSFYSIVRLLDPFIATSADDLTQEKTKSLVIRRLKSHIKNPDGSLKFQRRDPKTIAIEFATKEERNLYGEVTKYADEVWKKAKSRSQMTTVGFAMSILKKRLISSYSALAKSLEYRLNNISADEIDTSSYRGLLTDYLDGIPLSEKQVDRVEQTLLAASLEETLEWERGKLTELLKLATILIGKDSKSIALLEFLNGFFKDDTTDKIIIFTEYRDTQDYLQSILKANRFDGKIALMHGGMTRKQRREQEDLFHNTKTRILLATDAASEGLNLQKDCSTIIHYELPWNPNRLEQRNGRIDRWGQSKTVHIYNFHLNDTYESEILERLKEKIYRIHTDFGSTSDILGAFASFNINEFMMGSGGLRQDLENYEEKIKRADQGIDKHLSEWQAIKEQWHAQSFLHSNPYGEQERKKVAKILDETEQILPDFDALRELISLVVSTEGGSVNPIPTNGIFSIVVPKSLQGSNVKDFYRQATFRREIAVENRDVEFITPLHPLTKSIIMHLRSSIYSSSRVGNNRMSYRVIANKNGVEPGILFTFTGRFVNGLGEIIAENLIPIFVNLDGSPSYTEKDNFAILKMQEIAVNVDMNLLETHYKNKLKPLFEVARNVAIKKLEEQLSNIVQKGEGYSKKALVDLERWRSDYVEHVKKRYMEDPYQMKLTTQPIVVYRMQSELNRIEQKVKQRREKIVARQNIKAEGPFDLGALMIITQDAVKGTNR